MKVTKNGACWCGSGKKYKACHYQFDQRVMALKAQGKIVPTHDLIKNDKDIKGVKASAKINTLVLDEVEKRIKAGMTTQEIDDIVTQVTHDHQAICAPYQYEGFPKSVCTSINEVVCHGIPSSERVLKEGDIVNVDVSTIYKGYYSDASRMFMIGKVSEEAARLVQVTKECLEIGIAAVKPWGYIGDIGAAINEHAKKNGYSVVRVFGGHGIGKEFHEEPFVAHVGVRNSDMLITPGMMFTIEPMINQGHYDVVISDEDGWTVSTKDGKLSAQWEAMLLVTNTGVEILTQ